MPIEYRVVKSERHDGTWTHSVRSVMLADDGTVVHILSDDEYPEGATVETLRYRFELLTEALGKPVIPNPLEEEDWGAEVDEETGWGDEKEDKDFGEPGSGYDQK